MTAYIDLHIDFRMLQDFRTLQEAYMKVLPAAAKFGKHGGNVTSLRAVLHKPSVQWDLVLVGKSCLQSIFPRRSFVQNLARPLEHQLKSHFKLLSTLANNVRLLKSRDLEMCKAISDRKVRRNVARGEFVTGDSALKR